MRPWNNDQKLPINHDIDIVSYSWLIRICFLNENRCFPTFLGLRWKNKVIKCEKRGGGGVWKHMHIFNWWQKKERKKTKKTPVKFQNDPHKTMREFALTTNLLFYTFIIFGLKNVRLKMWKGGKKIISGFWKKQMHIFRSWSNHLQSFKSLF